MSAIFARKALLPGGWQRDVRIETADGRIASVRPGSELRESDTPAGVVVPGLTNAHSHAFQRALAGYTEQRGPDEFDNFWSWRERMYRLANVVDAPRLTAIARQLYTEMLTAGFTSVVEFHYLHAEPGKAAGEVMFEALLRAADDAGIRLTYVPVLYERAGFETATLGKEQRQFAHDLASFLRHYRRATELAGDAAVVGIGAHSLRAVTMSSLSEIAAVSASDDVPLHIHVAEQRREVDQCVAINGRRPVRWLLESQPVDARWCLVHATHLDDDEVSALAQSGAVVCLCPSTEANLGDGLFPLTPYLTHGGRIAIGSDSHISVNPFEELRWLEYGQRLAAEARNIAAIGARHTGRVLFELACAGGAQSAGIAAGAIANGQAADLLLFDDEDAMLLGHDERTLLDALVFSGFSLPLDRVMVRGKWQVNEGQHRQGDAARAAFRPVQQAVAAALAELDA